MGTVAVLDASGHPLMPTNSYRARKLLKSGRARIHSYRPVFTVRLLDRVDGDIQPVEYKCDTGYQHIGISVSSRKHEYVNAQYDLLANEVERHNDSRKYRRTRRNRLGYRKPRFDNRKGVISDGGFAPSIRNRRDCHIRLFEQYAKVIPVTDAYFEMGQFDTQVLKAIEEGKPLPEGAGYQQGERYGTATLREAVFSRDDYTCIVCRRNVFKDKAILHVHHTGFWKGDRTNRLANLGSVCERCHTSANHKPGGKLYGLDPKLKQFKGATFMTMVRWDMWRRIKDLPCVSPNGIKLHMTYGAATKLARKELGIKKTHSNDAWCMGTFHPAWRTDFLHYAKRRRNNRVLEKFYNAKYTDLRDGSRKSGSQPGCNRTNRSIPRRNTEDLRMYRAGKVSKGRRAVRLQRYEIQPGDIIFLLEESIIRKESIAAARGS